MCGSGSGSSCMDTSPITEPCLINSTNTIGPAECANHVITGLLVVAFLLLCLVLLCCWCRARRKRAKIYTLPSTTNALAELEASQVHGELKRRPSKPVASGVYSSVHISACYDEIKTNNLLNPSAPVMINPNYAPDEEINRRGYSIVGASNRNGRSNAQDSFIVYSASHNELPPPIPGLPPKHKPDPTRANESESDLTSSMIGLSSAVTPSRNGVSNDVREEDTQGGAQGGIRGNIQGSAQGGTQEVVPRIPQGRTGDAAQRLNQEDTFSVCSNLLPADYEAFYCRVAGNETGSESGSSAATEEPTRPQSIVPIEESLYSNSSAGNQKQQEVKQDVHKRSKSERKRNYVNTPSGKKPAPLPRPSSQLLNKPAASKKL